MLSSQDSVKPMLVVGGNSGIGRQLVARLSESQQPVIATTRSPGNLPNSIRLDLAEDSLPTLPPARAAVICAAITRQDLCRQDPAGTRRVNVSQTLKLVRELIARETFVVFLSTNLVFDGTKPLRQPDDPHSPQTEYGRQKAEVEQALAQWPRQTAVVRLTKVFHAGLPLLQKWRDELTAGRAVNAFSDYVCSPVHMAAVVEGIARVALEQRPGIWQFSGCEDVSYSALALCIASHCGADAQLVRSAPAPASAVEALPRHTTLDATRTRTELGLDFPGPGQVLARCLNARS